VCRYKDLFAPTHVVIANHIDLSNQWDEVQRQKDIDKSKEPVQSAERTEARRQSNMNFLRKYNSGECHMTIALQILFVCLFVLHCSY
jgi:hypothetical protein